jgi:hypothetical protein
VRNASISPDTLRTDRCGQGAVRVQRERDRSHWRENRGFALSFSTGTVAPGTLSLFLIGLPAVALGTWTGLKLFDRLNEAAFRRVVLVLLLASGVALLFHLR